MITKTHTLVKQYIALYKDQKKLDKKMANLKKKIAAFSKASDQKILKFNQYTLRVSHKLKILFPKKNKKGRGEMLKLVKQSPEYPKTLSFDIVKLATLYRQNKLGKKLQAKLARFATQKRVFRFSLTKTVKNTK